MAATLLFHCAQCNAPASPAEAATGWTWASGGLPWGGLYPTHPDTASAVGWDFQMQSRQYAAAWQELRLDRYFGSMPSQVGCRYCMMHCCRMERLAWKRGLYCSWQQNQPRCHCLHSNGHAEPCVVDTAMTHCDRLVHGGSDSSNRVPAGQPFGVKCPLIHALELMLPRVVDEYPCVIMRRQASLAWARLHAAGCGPLLLRIPRHQGGHPPAAKGLL